MEDLLMLQKLLTFLFYFMKDWYETQYKAGIKEKSLHWMSPWKEQYLEENTYTKNK